MILILTDMSDISSFHNAGLYRS